MYADRLIAIARQWEVRESSTSNAHQTRIKPEN